MTYQKKIERDWDEHGAGLELAMRVGRLGKWNLHLPSGHLSCDDHWYSIMGCDPRQPINSITEFQPLIHPEDVVRVTEVSATFAELTALDEDYGIEFRIMRSDGEIRWMRSLASLTADASGVPLRATGYVMDITETVRLRQELEQTCKALVKANATLASQKQQLERLSLTDGLTGIANRRCFDTELSRALAHLREPGTVLSIALIDIDNFKSFNDGYGHLAGDAALRAVAQTLRAGARRRTDLAARYGGEEFALLLPDCRAPSELLASVAESIRALKIPHAHSEVHPFLTVSIGCVMLRSPLDHSAEKVLRKCDQALYEAKRSGRNRIAMQAREGDRGRI